MNVCGPELFELFALLLISFVGIVADSGYIVGKRVEPNVGYVLRILLNGNTPSKRGTGNAKILKTCLEEVVYDLFLTAFGLDELRLY